MSSCRHTVLCIGELLIDFFCTDVGVDLISGQYFEKQAGGAPANVCATIVKMGGTAMFSGKIGNDAFGQFLKNKLDEVKVDTSMLVLDEKHPTTMAFVSLKESGERDFIFNRGADAFLMEDEIDSHKLRSAAILHFGSATALLQDPFRTTYLKIMKETKMEGKFISFDPNYRSALWQGRDNRFIDLVKKCIAYSDFVKVSDEELKLITGEEDLGRGVQILYEFGARVVTVTLGKNGTFLSNGKEQEVIPSIKVDAIDSTGAGDAFVGAMLYQLSKEVAPDKLLEDFEQLKRITSVSNRVGAMVCTKIGAISARPTPEEIELVEE